MRPSPRSSSCSRSRPAWPMCLTSATPTTEPAMRPSRALSSCSRSRRAWPMCSTSAVSSEPSSGARDGVVAIAGHRLCGHRGTAPRPARSSSESIRPVHHDNYRNDLPAGEESALTDHMHIETADRDGDRELPGAQRACVGRSVGRSVVVVVAAAAVVVVVVVAVGPRIRRGRRGGSSCRWTCARSGGRGRRRNVVVVVSSGASRALDVGILNLSEVSCNRPRGPFRAAETFPRDLPEVVVRLVPGTCPRRTVRENLAEVGARGDLPSAHRNFLSGGPRRWFVRRYADATAGDQGCN